MGELGMWLVRAREARGLTVEDAERDTRISRRYLQALESENFEVIPAPVYARGFLRSYSQYLGLDPVEMLALFPGDDIPAPVIGGPRGQSGNVGVGTPAASQKPTMKNPLSGQSAARPQWNKPAARKEPAMPRRPQPRQQPQPLEAPPQEYEIGGSMPPPREPMIGVDIGVPTPVRNLNVDPAAQRRNLTVLGVAAGVIIVVIVIAVMISRAGGSSGTPATTPTSEASIGSTAATATSPSGTAQTSGVAITPGVVPQVEGLPIAQARLALTEAGYKIREITDEGCTGTKGTVTQQAPDAGQAREAGAQVNVSVCSGP